MTSLGRSGVDFSSIFNFIFAFPFYFFVLFIFPFVVVSFVFHKLINLTKLIKLGFRPGRGPSGAPDACPARLQVR